MRDRFDTERLTIADALPDHLCVIDADGRIIAVNRAWREFARANGGDGARTGEGANYFDVCRASGEPEALEAERGLRAVLEGREARFTLRYACHAPSERRWFELTATRVGQGASAQAVVRHENVTEGRLAHDALRDSQTRFAAIANSLPGVVYRCRNDAQWTMEFISDTIESITGCSAAEFMSGDRLVASVVHPDDLERVTAELDAAVTRDDSFSLLYRMLHRDGGVRHVTEHGRAQRDERGEVVWLNGVVLDITAQVAAESALQDAEARYTAIAEHIPGVVYRSVYDKDWTMLHVSPGAEDITGYPASDFINNRVRTAASIVHPEDVEHSESVIADAIARREPYSVQYRLVHRNGSTVWISERGRAQFGDDGRVKWVDGVIIDVTKQVEAEEALRKNQERYKLAIEAASDGVWDWNLATDEAFLSPRWKEIIGFAPDEGENTGAWFFSRIHPDDRERVRAATEAHFATGAAYEPEFRMQTKSGQWRWCQSRGRAEFDARGKPVRMIGSTADITERKQSEDKFRVLFECSSQPHLLFGDRDVIDCNNAALEALRCDDKAEVVGRHPAGFSPERQPCGRESLEMGDEMCRMAHEAGFNRFEWIHRRFDGEEFPVEVSLTPVEIAGERVLLVLWHDLTERKRAETEQRRLLDVLSERVKEMRTLNKALAILQQDEELGIHDALGLIVEELPPGWLSPERTAARIVYDGREHSTGRFSDHRWSIREMFRTSDGCEGFVEVAYTDDDAAHDPFLDEERDLLATIADAIRVNIDRRIAAEHLREAKEAAEAANAAKTEFLANMSHEIRTPMTAILGYADLLSDESQSPGDRDDCIATIRRNGDHLLAVINDILDISRIESGRMTIERIDAQPARVVEDCLSLLRPRAIGKGVSLDARYTTRVPRTICTDPTRLRQILLNLLGNAIKFTETGGVTIEVGCTGCERGACEFVIDVVDTGVGIAPEQRERIFRPFSQGDSSTTRVFGGAGLGLVISKRLAELLGGNVRLVESRLGRGSRFRLTLPASGADFDDLVDGDDIGQIGPTPRSAPHQPSQAGLSARILLAEDGPDNQRLIAFHLRRAGAEVVVAENGREAVEMLRRSRAGGPAFDLVLMDMQMPEMDGYEATRRLRAMGFTPPIIALTAHAMAGDREKCLAAGCDAYETKPIDAHRLIELCAESLARHGQAA